MHDEAWDELLAAKRAGWHVGQPMFHDERNEWQLYAFDPFREACNGSTEARVDRDRANTGASRARDGTVLA